MFCSLALPLDQVQHLPESNDLIAAHIKHFTSTQPHQETFDFWINALCKELPLRGSIKEDDLVDIIVDVGRIIGGRHPAPGAAAAAAWPCTAANICICCCASRCSSSSSTSIRLRARYPRALRDDMIAHTPRLRRWLLL